MCSLSLSQNQGIKGIDLAYQNSTISVGVCQCMGLSTAYGMCVF